MPAILFDHISSNLAPLTVTGSFSASTNKKNYRCSVTTSPTFENIADHLSFTNKCHIKCRNS